MSLQVSEGWEQVRQQGSYTRRKMVDLDAAVKAAVATSPLLLDDRLLVLDPAY